MIRVLLITLMLLGSSCKLFKKSCIAYTLQTEHVEMVQAAGDNSMYSFIIPGGDLEGKRLNLNYSEASGMVDAFVVQNDQGASCEAVEKDRWTWLENKDLPARTVSLKATVSLQCGGKNYCFTINYNGPIEKMPGMP